MEAIDDYAKRNFVTDHKGNVFRNQKERSLKYGLLPTTVALHDGFDVPVQ